MTTHRIRHLVLDIETGPLPVEAREFLRPTRENVKLGNLKDPAKIEAKIAEEMAAFKSGDGAALDAISGQVLLAGCMDADTGEVWHFSGPERELLIDLWDFIFEVNPDNIIGHNVLAFDAPFLVRRSMVSGVKVPTGLMADLLEYRPSIWADTMRVWACGDRQHRVSLDHLCGVFGIESPKGGPINGATFATHWAAGNFASCKAYNEDDLRATALVAKKLGVIR
jgi:hypothetical protein